MLPPLGRRARHARRHQLELPRPAPPDRPVEDFFLPPASFPAPHAAGALGAEQLAQLELRRLESDFFLLLFCAAFFAAVAVVIFAGCPLAHGHPRVVRGRDDPAVDLHDDGVVERRGARLLLRRRAAAASASAAAADPLDLGLAAVVRDDPPLLQARGGEQLPGAGPGRGVQEDGPCFFVGFLDGLGKGQCF